MEEYRRSRLMLISVLFQIHQAIEAISKQLTKTFLQQPKQAIKHCIYYIQAIFSFICSLFWELTLFTLIGLGSTVAKKMLN